MAYWRISKLDWKNGNRFGSCDKILEPLSGRKAIAFCLAILQWMTGKAEVRVRARGRQGEGVIPVKMSR